MRAEILKGTLGFCLLLPMPLGAKDKAAPVYVKQGKLEEITANPGESREVAVPFVVTRGFHIQSNPASQRQLIATILDIPSKDGVQVGPPSYPKGKPYRLKGGKKQEISVYDGSFEVKLPLAVSEQAAAGKVILAGVLKFQACDDSFCFFPTKIPVELGVNISPK